MSGARSRRCAPRAPSRADYGIGGLTAYGTLLGDYSYDWLQRELVRPFYFTDNERLPQYATEAVLRAPRGANLPSVQTLLRLERRGRCARTPDGVTLAISERDGGGTQHGCAAHYVVGCDGSRSIVREQAGITQTPCPITTG